MLRVQNLKNFFLLFIIIVNIASFISNLRMIANKIQIIILMKLLFLIGNMGNVYTDISLRFETLFNSGVKVT